jgi:hypothetical protein
MIGHDRQAPMVREARYRNGVVGGDTGLQLDVLLIM